MKFTVRVLAQGRACDMEIDAINEEEARRQLTARSLHPISIAHPKHSFLTASRKSRFSLINFSQEILVLLEAGLTVVEAIDALLEKERNTHIHLVLEGLKTGMHQGRGFAGAMEEHPNEFPALFVNIVRASEKTSNLAEALTRYIAHESQLIELKTKVIKASIYPTILLAVGSLVTAFLLGYVVPKFASVYQETGRDLPKLSSILIAWGGFADRNPLTVSICATIFIISLIIFIRFLKSSGKGMQIILRIPVLEKHVKSFQLARFYLTVGMLIEGGLPISQALLLVRNVVGLNMRAGIDSSRELLRQGECISEALFTNNLTTPIALRMLRVGERSGRMGNMMTKISKTYDLEVTHAVEWFSRVFEPLLMTIIGLVIGIIVILLYMPIFDLAGSLQ